MSRILSSVHAALWGAPGLAAILGVGLYLTVRLGFVQLRLLPAAFRRLGKLLRGRDPRGKSARQALCTALAATVGTGNLVGVAGAICLGGPGSVFWMWVCGLLGMATKYTETVLALRYRVKTREGWSGGPMHTITGGLGSTFLPLARAYAAFGVAAAFGVGNAAQVSSAAAGIRTLISGFGREPSATGDAVTGLVLAAVLGAVLLGGAKRIGRAAEAVVPLAAVGYVALCAAVLWLRAGEIPGAFGAIFRGAVCPRAVTGGMLGSAFQALRTGCSRGVFTNEAGMGTASIAYASAEAEHPAEQGLMGLVEVFADTMVICTLTALVILVSGVPVPYGLDRGTVLTGSAFACVLGPWAEMAVGIVMVLLACATVLGWGYYGGRCAEFLLGGRAWTWFSLLQIPVIFVSAVADTACVWLLSETLNGLMAIPNLFTLAVLAPEAARLTKDYIRPDGKSVSGGYYADFHQRKPLRTFSYEKVPPSGRGCQKRGQKDLPPEHRSA